MRFLILIFVLFLGCEDDPVSPPDTDDGSINNNNEIVGQWAFEFTQVYNNADCQSDYSHNIDGQAQIMHNDWGYLLETYTKIDRRYLSNGVSLGITFICDDENLSINCTYSGMWDFNFNSSYNIVEESNGFTNLTLVESDITQVQGPIDFYSENDEQFMMFYSVYDNNEGCGVAHFKKVPEIEIQFPEFVEGCTIYPGEYYNEDANVLCFDCCGNIYGCTDSNACNSFSFATVDDGSCLYINDCANACGGDAVEDNCGICDNDSENDCTQDCLGTWGGDVEFDACGVCNGNDLNEDGYHCGDLQVLQDFIDINPSLAGQNSLEIGNQVWNFDGRLRELDLHTEYGNNEQLTSIPESIGDLSNLVYLLLYNNELASIPESIGNLYSLKELVLFQNQLITIPQSIENLSNLEVLSLTDNNLESLPENFCNIPSDCEIHLNGNNLCREHLYDCIPEYQWHNQDQSNCCEGVNDEGETVPSWTTCPE